MSRGPPASRRLTRRRLACARRDGRRDAALSAAETAAVRRDSLRRPITTSTGIRLERWTNGKTRVRSMDSAPLSTSSKPWPRIALIRSVMVSGGSSTVTSTSALSRGLPQTIAACAPKRYHLAPVSRIAAAMPCRASTTAGGVDTSEALRDSRVRGEIALPLVCGRPFGPQLGDVVAQFVANAQRLFGGQFLRRPVRALPFCGRGPVASRESDQIFFPHAARITEPARLTLPARGSRRGVSLACSPA